MEIEVINDGSAVLVKADGHRSMPLSWPEANRLQDDLRRACVDAGITLLRTGK